ncbi:MAG: hypothetical protein AABM42_10595 [Actinomycetota bacterium]
MDGKSASTFWEQLSAAARAFGKWVDEHQHEIRAFGIWGTVSSACRESRLYAPMHSEAWLEIVEAVHGDDRPDPPDYERIIISAYQPGSVGFEALPDELLDAPLLRDRLREVAEVLDSLADGRNYVAVCGALPLIEYVISKAAGKWNHPQKHVAELKRRLHDDEIDGDDAILLEFAAVEMILEEIPNVWKAGRQQVGAIVGALNRQYALHGAGLGWDDSTNATRAVLLLAAAARVADPLFKPPTTSPAGAS